MKARPPAGLVRHKEARGVLGSMSGSERDGSRRLSALALGFCLCAYLILVGAAASRSGPESPAPVSHGGTSYRMAAAGLPGFAPTFEPVRDSFDLLDVPPRFSGSPVGGVASGLDRIRRPSHPIVARPHASNVPAGFLSDRSTAPPSPTA